MSAHLAISPEKVKSSHERLIEKHGRLPVLRYQSLVEKLFEADTEMLVSTVLELLSDKPESHRTVLYTLRFQPEEDRPIADADKAVSELFSAIDRGREVNWTRLNGELKNYFEAFSAESPNLIPTIEYCLDRILFFLHLQSWDDDEERRAEAEPAVNFLINLHCEAIRRLGYDRMRLVEQIANWHIDYGYQSIDLTNYAELLDTETKQHYREIVEMVWLTHVEKESCEDPGGCEVSAFLVAAAKETGTTIDLSKTCFSQLQTVEDYLSAMELLQDQDLDNEAKQLAQLGMEKFPNEDNFAFEDFFIEQSEKEGNYDEVVLRLKSGFERDPDAVWIRELKVLCQKHPEKLSWIPLRQEFFAIIDSKLQDLKEGSIEFAKTNTIKVETLVNDGELEAAWETAAKGCWPRVLLKMQQPAEKGQKQNVELAVKAGVDIVCWRRSNSA